MTILHELHLRRPDLLRNHEVYIDGGVTRGTDVLKALCLGARAVGMGRAFLYANGAWGEEGCRRVVESKYCTVGLIARFTCVYAVRLVMRDEIERGMRLLGVTKLEELTPELIRYE